MSVHKSLRSSLGLVRARNVLTRAERMVILKREGRLAEGASLLGLPKTKVLKAKPKGKKKKDEDKDKEKEKGKK